MITVIDERGQFVCESCEVADHPLARLRGLLGRHSLADETGLLIQPGWSIHTWFMRFPIDVVFLDREFRVLDVVANLVPWRAATRRGARAALELPAGSVARKELQPGMRLGWGAPASSEAA